MNLIIALHVEKLKYVLIKLIKFRAAQHVDGLQKIIEIDVILLDFRIVNIKNEFEYLVPPYSLLSKDVK
jgi:hypothetical protein